MTEPLTGPISDPTPGRATEADQPSPVATGLPPPARRWWKLIRAALHIAIPIAVVILVRHELLHLNLGLVRDQLRDSQSVYAIAAAGTGIIAVTCMGLYDVLAFPRAGRFGRLRRWGLGATCFAWTNFLTLGPIGGPALRVHFYRPAGMPLGDILRGVARMYACMFAGLATWVAVVLLPLPVGPGLNGLLVRTAIVVVLAPALAVIIGLVATRWKRLEQVRAPWWKMALMGLVGVVDWGGGLAAFVLASRAIGVTSPEGDMARTMVIGNLVGMASMIPGGIGAAEGTWLRLLKGASLDENTALAIAVMFRLTFYIVPWTIGLIVLYASITRASPAAAVWQRRLLAVAATVNAALLLAGAAVPTHVGRIQRVADYMPMDVLEVSRAVAVVSAAVMLFLVRGLLFGYRGAFVMCGGLLAASIGAHLVAGSDYPEMLLPGGLLIMLLGARHSFERRGRIPIGWELTLAAALGSTLFVVLVSVTSFPEVRYTHDLWLRFEGSHVEAARLLRGVALVAGVGLVFLVRQAVRPARHDNTRGAAADAGPPLGP